MDKRPLRWRFKRRAEHSLSIPHALAVSHPASCCTKLCPCSRAHTPRRCCGLQKNMYSARIGHWRQLNGHDLWTQWSRMDHMPSLPLLMPPVVFSLSRVSPVPSVPCCLKGPLPICRPRGNDIPESQQVPSARQSPVCSLALWSRLIDGSSLLLRKVSREIVAEHL